MHAIDAAVIKIIGMHIESYGKHKVTWFPCQISSSLAAMLQHGDRPHVHLPMVT